MASTKLQISGISKGKWAKLRARAKSLGMTPEAYARELIEDGMELDRKARRTTFDELLAPVREQFKKIGMTESELDTLVDEARTRHHRRVMRKTA